MEAIGQGVVAGHLGDEQGEWQREGFEEEYLRGMRYVLVCASMPWSAPRIEALNHFDPACLSAVGALQSWWPPSTHRRRRQRRAASHVTVP